MRQAHTGTQTTREGSYDTNCCTEVLLQSEKEAEVGVGARKGKIKKIETEKVGEGIGIEIIKIEIANVANDSK